MRRSERPEITMPSRDEDAGNDDLSRMQKREWLAIDDVDSVVIEALLCC